MNKRVIKFPRERVSRAARPPKDGIPSVIILPVIRIESPAPATPSDEDRSARICALLRRRTLSPHQGRSVMIEFETEAEALEFQKLIHALPKSKRRRKR